MRSFVLIALLALPGLLVSQSASDETGIHGYVLAPGGVPVSGGTVVYVSSLARASTSIDRFGRFRILPDRAGLYRVVVSVPGFAPYPFRVTVPLSRTLRLPVIHLGPATFFRVRFVSSSGESIMSPAVRRRSFDASNTPILEAPGAASIEFDADGATRIGPLPHGVTTLALDTQLFAQTRVPNFSVTGSEPLVDSGTIVVQSGSTLHITVLDESGMPVPDWIVALEDVVPMSPLQFQPMRTSVEGRVTFERLAAGRYRVRTAALGKCVSQPLSVARTVMASGTGVVNARIFIAGTATFRVSSPLGPLKGVSLSVRPDNPPPASPALLIGRGAPSLIASSLTMTNCRGRTDAEGRVTLTSFPPGPSDVAVQFANSLYVRRLEVPLGGSEVAISIPDGFLPVRVVDTVKREAVPRAFVTWTIDGGGRAEATATISGDALLEAVGSGPGILTVTATGFQPAEEHLPEPPGIAHEVALVPLAAAATLSVRVVSASGEALPDAVVEVSPANPLEAPQIAVTDSKGVVTFPDAPAGTVRVTANANGYAAATMRMSQANRAGAVALSPGYRAVVSVDLPAAWGPLLVRLLDRAGRPMDQLLDGASERGIEPPGRLSLGPLPPGDYVIELRGAREQRQESIRIVNRDIAATVR